MKSHRSSVRGNSRGAQVIMEAIEDRTLFAMPTLWTSHGPGGGGAFFGASIKDSTLWVASDMSGLYHSGDLGQKWQMQNFHNDGTTGGIRVGSSSQVSFTSDPDILYIANSSLSVAKSTDGGKTWNRLTGWAGGTAYWSAVDQTGTQKLLVANANNLYISTNGGASFSTAYSSSSLYVAGAFFDGNNVYVGTNKGLLVSSNGGASFSLHSQQLPAGQRMISFAGAKENGVTRFLAISTTANPTPGTSPRSYSFSNLYRMDLGGSWVSKTSTILNGDLPKFVGMARNDIDSAMLGGVDAAGRPQVLRTTNGGDSFADVFFTRPTDGGGVPNKNVLTGYMGQGGDFDWSWSGTPWSFVVSTEDPNDAMLVNSGFIHITTDGGVTWRQAYTNPADQNPMGLLTPKNKAYRGVGVENTSVHYLTWTGPQNIMAAYTDITGWRSTDGGTSWAYPQWNGVADNTVYETLLAPDGKLYGAASNVHDMYQGNYLLDNRTNPTWQNGRVIVSNDQGASWSMIHEFGHPVVQIELDPNNANRMYATVVDGITSPDSGAFGGVWVTNNLNLGSASTWTKLTNPPRTEGHTYSIKVLNDGTLVATYSGRRALNGQGVEQFTDSSGVFVSTDGGQSWLDRSHANMHWYTKDITIDPTDPSQNTWYAAVANGWSGMGNDLGDVYRSTNRGQTWTKLNIQNTLGVLSIGVNSTTINSATKEMYVSTETRGILYTADVTKAGLSGADFVDLLEYPHSWTEKVFINPYNPSDVWVASFGAGIWRGGVGPSDLTAVSPGSTSVTFLWSDNASNETGYELQRSTSPDFSTNVASHMTGVNTERTTFNGLTSQTTYYFRVRAVAGENASAWSNVVSETTAAAQIIVSDPTNIQGTAVSSSQVNLTWTDNSNNEAGFQIQQATSILGPYTDIHVGTTPNQTSHSVTGLTGGTTYYFRVRAYAGSNTSNYSNIATVTTGNPTVSKPLSPSKLKVVSTTSNSVSLGWADNASNETGYKVEMASSSSGPWNEIYVGTTTNQKTYTATNLSAGTTYYFRVRGYNTGGNSGYTLVVAGTTTGTPGGVIVNAPDNLTATPDSSSQINLSWIDNATNETGFKIERATSSGGPWTLIHTGTTADQTSYNATGLSADTTYHFRVRAYSGATDSGNSNSASARTLQSTTSPVVYQSENGARGGGTTIDANHTGYTGTGFANLPSSGGYVQWDVNAAAAGSHALTFRYALGSGSRNVQLMVNGVIVTGGVTFTSTGAWNNWATVTVNANLLGGANTIRVTSIGQDGGNIDSLSVAAADGGTPAPSVTEYGAEDATRVGGATLDSNHAGYSGAGFINFPSSGGYAEWNVDAASAGSHELSFRYALASGTRNVQLSINGSIIAGGVTFTSTGAWSNWSEVSKTVNLAAGTNTIRLTSTGQDSGNIDYLAVAKV